MSKPIRGRLLVLTFVLMSAALPALPTRGQGTQALAAPALKWQRGGCFASWCQTGWYASPAVADLDGDGRAEVIWGSYDVVALNGEDGSLQWRGESENRVWPGVAVADLEGNGSLEVIVGRGGDEVTAYGSDGGVLWRRAAFGGGEVRTLAVADLDGDGPLEVIVGRASGGATKQVNVFEAGGAQRAGFPARRDGEPGDGWGMYNENVAVADLDGDGRMEIYAPTDTHYITALDPSGGQLPVDASFGRGRRFWSEVGVHVDLAADLRGFANCGSEHRPNFANAAPAAADLDGDGTRELVVPGDVYNCAIGDPEGDMYYLPWIFRQDRTRWSGGGFDWTVLPAPAPDSAPRSQDFGRIQTAAVNAVPADLDGDGRKEILYPSYDGRLHAYWLDKTQRGSWPFDVPGSGIRFASEPVVADLDGDGRAEVLVGSWPENGGGRVGQLHVLDWQGRQLHAVDLPAPLSGSWNGSLGAPTLADIDGDPELELVLGTVASGVVAYDLPGSAGARVLWGTGRGSMQRTGVAAESGFRLAASPAARAIRQGEAASYELGVIAGEGFRSAVTLSAGPAPSGLALGLSTASITPGQRATLTLTDTRALSPLPPPSLWSVPVTATGGGVTATLTVTLLVGGEELRLPALAR
jgi:hypothetical protein